MDRDLNLLGLIFIILAIIPFGNNTVLTKLIVEVWECSNNSEIKS